MRPAARVDDEHLCPLNAPTVHVGGPVLPPGAVNTTINGHHAARVTDKAFCVAPAPDTVRGGLMTLFIEGNPASRFLDKTDVGNIIVGSPNVLYGEWAGGPLSLFQAQWLYNYMASQHDIPFEYATDGCFARADRMASYMESLGIDTQKQWVEANPGTVLHVPIANYDDGMQTGGVTWGWHVAPVVHVAGPGSASTPMVIDPSLSSGGPVTVDQWVGKQTTDPSKVSTWSTPPSVYFDRQITGGSADTMRDPATTSQNLEEYRKMRANLPPSTGRNIPNAPVHV